MSKYAPITNFPCWYGKYELLRRLGYGGMAEVFLARLPGPEGFERTVVIKRILPALAHEQRMEESFIAEATLAAQVQHDNIVHVYELQRLDNGELFMSMEYIDGTDLAHLFRAANKRKLRIPPWFSVKCLAEVLDGLSYAHELKDKNGRPRNLVHRDVTPSNIFVSKAGAVKLADFGVARDETRRRKTLRGELKGKLSYMPPEQLRREPIDRRTDIFAVGVVLWEFLAQRRLFGGANRPEIDTMNLICSAPRVPPSKYQRDVHPDLDRCVLRALQVDPEARYQDAGGFRQQLVDILDALHPGTQQSDMCEVVEMMSGERPAPPVLTLNAAPTIVDPADYTRTDSAEGETEVASSASGPSRASSASGRIGISRSYSGEFPFWLRAESGILLGPQNYWDMIDGLKRSANPALLSVSTDSRNWIGLDEFARLTGQEGIFFARKTGRAQGKRVLTSLLTSLADLSRRRASGTLEIDFASGAAEVSLLDGGVLRVISSHPQLQGPEILVRDSVLNAAQLPATVHQVVSDRLPLEEVAAVEGWHDAEHLRARAVRARLGALLGELAQLHFRAEPKTTSDSPPLAMLPLLPPIVHDAMSARTLRMILSSRLKSRLTPTESFEASVEAMKLSNEEQMVVEHLIEGEPMETLIERHAEYETFYLYLAYLLLELGLVEAS